MTLISCYRYCYINKWNRDSFEKLNILQLINIFLTLYSNQSSIIIFFILHQHKSITPHTLVL
jgi:hypothetical protein